VKPERVCEVCGGPRPRGNMRFCSKKCEGKWRSLNQRGKNNPAYKREVHERLCETCGKRRARQNKMFCSRKCRAIASRGHDKIERLCANCGGHFFVYPSDLIYRSAKFCNVQCRAEYQKRRGKVYSCPVCGEQFYRSPAQLKDALTCSRECLAILHHRENNPRWTRVRKECLNCGECYYVVKHRHDMGDGNYCSRECADAHKGRYLTGLNNPNWRGGVKNYTSEFYNMRELIRDRDERTCQYCGVSESQLDRKLDVHHISYNTKDNREENLISLCVNCHVKTNGKRYFWEAYFKMKVQEKDSIQSRLHIIKEVKE